MQNTKDRPLILQHLFSVFGVQFLLYYVPWLTTSQGYPSMEIGYGLILTLLHFLDKPLLTINRGNLLLSIPIM